MYNNVHVYVHVHVHVHAHAHAHAHVYVYVYAHVYRYVCICRTHCIEDSSLMRSPFPLPCSFGGVYYSPMRGAGFATEQRSLRAWTHEHPAAYLV